MNEDSELKYEKFSCHHKCLIFSLKLYVFFESFRDFSPPLHLSYYIVYLLCVFELLGFVLSPSNLKNLGCTTLDNRSRSYLT